MSQTDRELFELRNGRIIMDEDLSDKMYTIKLFHPERADKTSSGFEWSEMEWQTRHALQQRSSILSRIQSWYTYFKGLGEKIEGSILVSEKVKDLLVL